MGTLSDWLSGAFGNLSNWLSTIWDWVKKEWSKLAAFLTPILKTIWGTLKSAARSIGKAVSDLAHGNWSALWGDLKSWWGTLKKWYGWYKKYIYGPVQRMRQNVQLLYNKFFAPLLKLIDSFRPLFSIIGVFDKKLAAKLDGYLFHLENIILTPITAINRRLNSITSWLAGQFTQLGFLDRPCLLGSIKRDAATVWKQLTNPLGLNTSPAAAAPASTPAQIKVSFDQYNLDGSGEFQQPIADAQSYYSDVLSQLS